MSNYDQQYFIISEPDEDDVPFLTPAKDTVGRQFSVERQVAGLPPFVFTNGWKKRNLAEGVTDKVAPVLFHGTDLVVSAAIRNALLDYDIPDLSTHPVIYIDDRDECHAGYWYLTFTELVDCWDRTTSETSSRYVETNGVKRYAVLKYALDKSVLDKMPLMSRLLFKMGGAVGAPVFFHQSIARIFRQGAPNGADLTLVADH